MATRTATAIEDAVVTALGTISGVRAISGTAHDRKAVLDFERTAGVEIKVNCKTNPHQNQTGGGDPLSDIRYQIDVFVLAPDRKGGGEYLRDTIRPIAETVMDKLFNAKLFTSFPSTTPMIIETPSYGTDERGAFGIVSCHTVAQVDRTASQYVGA